jgi:hypothetical protein
MSDPDPSGAAITATETASAPSAPPTTPTLPGPFSNSRGSGLARGKRPTSPAPQAASAAPAAEYKPTAVSILTAPTEYKNPFAPPAPAAPTADTIAPASEPALASAPVPAPSAPAIPVAEVAAEPAVQESRPPADPMPADPAVAEQKAELKILPPEAPRRVEQSWESESFRDVARQPRGEPVRPAEPQSGGQRPQREDRRGDRPYFRSERERRDDRPVESHEPRADYTPPGRNFDHGRPPAESTAAPAPVEPKKKGGLFGWVKKLFGDSPAEAPKPETQPEAPGQGEFNPNGPYRRRRRRGGRNHHFQGDQRGPRDGQSGGQPSGDQRGYRGEQRGYGGEQRHQGNRRHRHHGGGGFRGNEGFRGDRRPEGGPPPSGS